MTAAAWTRYESRALTVAGWEAHRSSLLADGWKFHDAFNDVVYIRRPAHAETVEVEVTEQMIAAGVEAYRSWAGGVYGAHAELAEAIYLAMHLARPLSEGPTP